MNILKKISLSVIIFQIFFTIACSDGKINIDDESANPTFKLDATIIENPLLASDSTFQYSFIINYTGIVNYNDISGFKVVLPSGSSWDIDVTKYSENDVYFPDKKIFGPFGTYYPYKDSSSLPLVLKLIVTFKNGNTFETANMIPAPGEKTGSYETVSLGYSPDVSTTTDYKIHNSLSLSIDPNTATGDISMFYSFRDEWVYNAYLILYNSSETIIGYSDYFRDTKNGNLQSWVSETQLSAGKIQYINIPSSALSYIKGYSSSNLNKVILVATDGKQFTDDGVYDKYHCKIYSNFGLIATPISSSTSFRESGLVGKNISCTSTYTTYHNMFWTITKQTDGAQISISDNGTGTTTFSFSKPGNYKITTYKYSYLYLISEDFSFTVHSNETTYNFIPKISKYCAATNTMIVYSTSPNSCLYQINIEDGSYSEIPVSSEFKAFSISPSGKSLCLYSDYLINIIDLSEKKIISSYTSVCKNIIMAISDNGYLYYSNFANNTYYLFSWKMADGTYTYFDIKHNIKSMAINSDNSVLYFFTSYNISINFCDMSNGLIIDYKMSNISNDNPNSLYFSDTGKIFASNQKLFITPQFSNVPTSITGISTTISGILNPYVSSDDKKMLFYSSNYIYSYDITNKKLYNESLYTTYTTDLINSLFYDLNGIKKAFVLESTSSKLITYW